jgi:hypothetical protein
MAQTAATRNQLCGWLLVKLGGRRVHTPALWLTARRQIDCDIVVAILDHL